MPSFSSGDDMEQGYALQHGLPSAQAAERAMRQASQGVHMDYHLKAKDIANEKAKLSGLEWRWHKDQAQSCREFTRFNPDLTLCYQEYQPASSSAPAADFVLAITTPELIEAAVKYGHGRPMAMDATCNTVNLKFPLFTLMVYDELNMGMPVAFLLTSSGSADNIETFLKSFSDACRKLRPDFAFSCTLTDNDPAELLAIRKCTRLPGRVQTWG